MVSTPGGGLPEMYFFPKVVVGSTESATNTTTGSKSKQVPNSSFSAFEDLINTIHSQKPARQGTTLQQPHSIQHPRLLR
eukprot:5047303-Alexandrium_andersonii.AAC.1